MADMCARALALPPGMSPATTDLPVRQISCRCSTLHVIDEGPRLRQDLGESAPRPLCIQPFQGGTRAAAFSAPQFSSASVAAPCALYRCCRRRRRSDRVHRTRVPRRLCQPAFRAAPAPRRFWDQPASLSSPSQVPCHSSPSTQVTPVTKRLDSIVRRIAPVCGSI